MWKNRKAKKDKAGKKPVNWLKRPIPYVFWIVRVTILVSIAVAGASEIVMDALPMAMVTLANGFGIPSSADMVSVMVFLGCSGMFLAIVAAIGYCVILREIWRLLGRVHLRINEWVLKEPEKEK